MFESDLYDVDGFEDVWLRPRPRGHRCRRLCLSLHLHPDHQLLPNHILLPLFSNSLSDDEVRVEHNRQLPWLLPWQLPLPLPCRRRHRDTSALPSQLPRPAAADADRGGTSSRAARRRRARCNGNGNSVDTTVHGACHTNKKITPKHRSHRGGS